MLTEVLVFGAAIPLAIALGICLWARRAFTRDQQLRAAGAFAVALGFVIAWLALPWASYTVERAWHWLPRLAIAGAGIGMFADGVPRAIRVGLRVGVAAFAGWSLVPDYAAFADSQLAWMGAVAVAIVLAWAVLERAATTAEPRGFALVLGIWIIGAALLMERCAIVKFAQLAGVVAASTAPVLLLLRGPAAFAGAVAPLAVLVPGLVMSGRFETHAAVPELSFVCILAVPFAVFASTRWWTPIAAAATLAAIGVGAAAAATL